MFDYAQLAQSLKDNEAFQRALDNQRNSALEALALVQPSNFEDIIMHQSAVRLIDAIRADLDQFIRSGTQKPPPGIA